MNRPAREGSALAGYAWMSIAVLIWASWLVLTSSGRTTSLSILDLAGFRALIPALVLAPLLWRGRRELARVGLLRCLVLSAYGAPFTLCVGYGLSFAPVAHAGAMVPGLAPLATAMLSAVLLGHRLSLRQMVSFLLILSASVTIILRAAGSPDSDDAWIGHLLFLLGATCWAGFTVMMKSLDISPYLATAIVGGLSTVFVAPVWIATDLSTLAVASGPDIAFQAVFQGVVSGLVSLFAFSKAIRLLGIRASVFSALTPGVATLLAVPVLGQVPDHIEILALIVVVAGLVVVSVGQKKPPDPASGHPARALFASLRQSNQR